MLTKEAHDKVLAANTPDESVAEATEATYQKLLTTVRINVGNIINLQKAAGQEVNPAGWTAESSVGTVFSGSVKPGLGDSAEVGGVYAPRKNGKA